MRYGLPLIVLLGSTCTAFAQVPLVLRERAPVNINDCTFVRDPTVLRDCLDLVEGQRLGPVITRSPSDPIVSPRLLREAGADPRGRLRGFDRAPRRQAARGGVRPVGFDPVRVEQVRPHPRRALDQ